MDTVVRTFTFRSVNMACSVLGATQSDSKVGWWKRTAIPGKPTAKLGDVAFGAISRSCCRRTAGPARRANADFSDRDAGFVSRCALRDAHFARPASLGPHDPVHFIPCRPVPLLPPSCIAPSTGRPVLRTLADVPAAPLEIRVSPFVKRSQRKQCPALPVHQYSGYASSDLFLPRSLTRGDGDIPDLQAGGGTYD